MRIWIINHFALSPDQSGGTRHYSLARSLIDTGHQVFLVASSVNYNTHKETRLKPGEKWRKEILRGVPFLWLRTPEYSGNGFGRLWNMLVFSYQLLTSPGIRQLGSPDAIIGSTPHLFAAWVSERLARRYHVPFLLEVRDLWPQALIEVGNFPRYHPLMWLFGQIERYLYRRANKVLTLLPGAKDYIVGKGGREADISWLPNGVDLSLVPQPQPVSSNGLFTVMYAGAHGPQNGLDLLLDAGALLQKEGWVDRIRIELVGDGADKARLQERARQENISTVSFRDPVPKREIYEVLQKANAFVMVLKNLSVYRWGISPNKLFDYFASARPIIFCVNTSINPVAEAQAGITVAPDDVRGLARAMQQLASMTLAERDEMASRGRLYIETHHDFRLLTRSLETILNEATVSSRPLSSG